LKKKASIENKNFKKTRGKRCEKQFIPLTIKKNLISPEVEK